MKRLQINDVYLQDFETNTLNYIRKLESRRDREELIFNPNKAILHELEQESVLRATKI